MKAARFEYIRAQDAAQAVTLLNDAPGFARPLAGGQSLGPMLNLRLTSPELLVDVRQCEDMLGHSDEPDAIVYGAALTHAQFEDGVVPDACNGFLASAARRIAYRAVRNRGTLGGSLAHADPAADWLSVLLALGAEVIALGPAGPRALHLDQLIVGPFASLLGPADVLVAVRLRKRAGRAKFGYDKLSVKSGEFARAFTVLLDDEESAEQRIVIGAIERKPLVIEGPEAAELLTRHPDRAGCEAWLRDRLPEVSRAGLRLHATSLRRALAGRTNEWQQ